MSKRKREESDLHLFVLSIREREHGIALHGITFENQKMRSCYVHIVTAYYATFSQHAPNEMWKKSTFNQLWTGEPIRGVTLCLTTAPPVHNHKVLLRMPPLEYFIYSKRLKGAMWVDVSGCEVLDAGAAALNYKVPNTDNVRVSTGQDSRPVPRMLLGQFNDSKISLVVGSERYNKDRRDADVQSWFRRMQKETDADVFLCENLDVFPLRSHIITPLTLDIRKMRALLTTVDEKSYIEAGVRFLELSINFSTVCGLPLGHIYNRASKVDYAESAIMHELWRLSILPPMKQEHTRRPYEGGHTLEAIKGWHRDVEHWDFASMYPWVIVDNKLCFSKVLHPELKARTAINSIMARYIKLRKESTNPVVNESVKLGANSVYGNFGNPKCRFYCPELAGRICELGKMNLLRAKSVAESLGGRILCGVTDSFMVKWPSPETSDLFDAAVNPTDLGLRMRRKEVISNMYVLNKTAYAVLTSQGVVRTSGLGANHKDIAPLFARLCEQLVGLALTNAEDGSIRQLINTTVQDLRSGRIPLEQLVISRVVGPKTAKTSELGKIAARQRVQTNGTVHYVVATPKTFRHPRELKDMTQLDVEYYIMRDLNGVLKQLASMSPEIQPVLFQQTSSLLEEEPVSSGTGVQARRHSSAEDSIHVPFPALDLPGHFDASSWLAL